MSSRATARYAALLPRPPPDVSLARDLRSPGPAPGRWLHRGISPSGSQREPMRSIAPPALCPPNRARSQAPRKVQQSRAGSRSLLVGRIDPLSEAQTGRPVFVALQKTTGIHELAMRVLAGFLARYRIVALPCGERCDLTLAGHLQKVMIDDAFGDAFAADQHAMIAQDQETAAIEVAHQFWRHFVIELETLELVIFDLAIESQC